MNWRVALRLGRVSNLPTVWTNILAATVLAGSLPGLIPMSYLLATFSFFYIAGMYLNDAFDRKFDANARPDRPIPSGQVTAQAVFVIGFVLLAAGEGILLFVGFGLIHGQGWPPVLTGLALAVAIIYYNASHKTNPFSPLVMGLCRGLVYVIAALTVAPGPPEAVLWGAGILVAYTVGLTSLARQEYLAEIKNYWPVLFLAIPFVYGFPIAEQASGMTIVIYCGFLAWVSYALSHLMGPRPRNIPRGITTLIAGMSFLDALLISIQGEDRLAVLALGGVALTRFFQRSIPGT